MMCVNVLYITRNKIVALFDKRKIFSPYTPIIKIAHVCVDMTLHIWAIIIMGVYGEISNILSDPAEIFGYMKNVDTHHESFISKKQVIKKLSPKSL